MKLSIGGYILVIAFVVAFIMLMTTMWKYIDDVTDGFRVILASLVIFVPNLLALVRMFRKKTQ